MSTCALVAASDFNAKHFKAAYDAGRFDAVFAVDAGFAHLEAIGCVPDMAIGDFDSLGFTPKCRRVIQLPVEKDKSDLEAAMDRAKTRRYDEVVIYGALGGRLDHTVANMQMCAQFAEGGMGVTLISEDFVLRIVVGPDVYELPLLDQGTVSVFAATDQAHGVIERGMKYSIDDETLTNRTTRGLSNELQGIEAVVAVEEGTLFVFHPLA